MNIKKIKMFSTILNISLLSFMGCLSIDKQKKLLERSLELDQKGDGASPLVRKILLK
jgi:hypothetical protein